MKKSLLASLVVLATLSLFLVGCDALQTLANNLSICTVVDCEQLGIVDITGSNNTLITTEPDYTKDPTCTVPGLCGANPWYPYSTATTYAPTSTSSSQ